MRTIKTPPPVPNLVELPKPSSLLSKKSSEDNTNTTTANTSSSGEGKNANNSKDNLVGHPCSITTSIREGKLEKPIRSNHAIPPPPPPPPALQLVVTTANKQYIIAPAAAAAAATGPSETTTSTSGGSRNTVKETTKVKKITPPSILTNINNQAVIENYLNSLEKNAEEPKGKVPAPGVTDPTPPPPHQPKESARQHKSSHQQQQQRQQLPPPPALKTQENAPAVTCKQHKEPATAAAPQTVSTKRESRKEEKLIALTNLPQLDKIDYIFKTHDEK